MELSSVGRLHYSQEDGQYRLVVEVDQGLSDYYRALIPKWMDVNRPRWPAHITVVRPHKEIPVALEFWGKYEGELVEFEYQNYLHSGKVYLWLNVFCKRLEEIRIELGLPVSSEFTRPPAGYLKCFHCTIANLK